VSGRGSPLGGSLVAALVPEAEERPTWRGVSAIRPMRQRSPVPVVLPHSRCAALSGRTAGSTRKQTARPLSRRRHARLRRHNVSWRYWPRSRIRNLDGRVRDDPSWTRTSGLVARSRGVLPPGAAGVRSHRRRTSDALSSSESIASFMPVVRRFRGSSLRVAPSGARGVQVTPRGGTLARCVRRRHGDASAGRISPALDVNRYANRPVPLSNITSRS
jgi:hypothetical protein